MYDIYQIRHTKYTTQLAVQDKLLPGKHVHPPIGCQCSKAKKWRSWKYWPNPQNPKFWCWPAVLGRRFYRAVTAAEPVAWL